MADWPILADSSRMWTHILASGATPITAGAANEKSGWSGDVGQFYLLDSSTSIVINFHDEDSASKNLFDFATYHGGSYFPIIENLLYQTAGHRAGQSVILPVHVEVPSGVGLVRVRARKQSSIASSITYISTTLISASFGPCLPGQVMTTYGVNLATTSGTFLQAPLANTWSTPVLVDTLDRDTRSILLTFGQRGSTGIQTARYLIDIGLDPACTNLVYSCLPVSARTSANQFGQVWLAPLPFCFPAGTEMWVRIRADVSGVSMELAIYGIS